MQSLTTLVAEGHDNSRDAFRGATVVTLDFGSVAVDAQAFTMTTPAPVGANVLMVASSATDGDELEMDGLLCAAHVSALNTIQAYITAVPGPISGTRTFLLYLV